MTEKKLTQKMVVEMMLADTSVNANATYVEYLKHQLDLLNRKSTSKGMTNTQKENVEHKETILTTLANATAPMSITEIIEANEIFVLNKFSNQKISALLTALINDNKVERVPGKKATFKLV